MADPFISLLGYTAVRHPFRIPGLLRPRGLPRLFLVSAWDRFFRSRGSAVRRRVDVDLCHRGLFDRGNGFRCAVTVASNFAPISSCEIGLATQPSTAAD